MAKKTRKKKATIRVGSVRSGSSPVSVIVHAGGAKAPARKTRKKAKKKVKRVVRRRAAPVSVVVVAAPKSAARPKRRRIVKRRGVAKRRVAKGVKLTRLLAMAKKVRTSRKSKRRSYRVKGTLAALKRRMRSRLLSPLKRFEKTETRAISRARKAEWRALKGLKMTAAKKRQIIRRVVRPLHTFEHTENRAMAKAMARERVTADMLVARAYSPTASSGKRKLKWKLF